MASWGLLLVGIGYAALALATTRLRGTSDWALWSAAAMAVAAYLASTLFYWQEIIVLAQQPQNFFSVEQSAEFAMAAGIIGTFVLGVIAWFQSSESLHGE